MYIYNIMKHEKQNKKWQKHTQDKLKICTPIALYCMFIYYFFFFTFFISSWHPTLDLILFFLNRHNTQVYIWYNIATFLFFIFFPCWCLCCCVLFDEDKKKPKEKNINSPVKHHTRRAVAISSRHTIICFLWVLYTICFLFFRFFIFPHKIPFYSLSFQMLFFFL